MVILAGRPGNTCAQTLTNLYSFGNSPSGGASPYARLVQGSDGNFYGTTLVGGTSNFGSVFQISPSGSYTNLYSFVGPALGAAPTAGLVQGVDGNFYGTTEYSGTSGFGNVFRISPSGSYTSLYSFVGYPSDGNTPTAGLVQGVDGNFYGTTYYGGTSNFGSVFRISSNGSYTNLHSFVGPSDGANPYAGLVQGSDGNLYGTTYSGGTSNFGSVYRISPSGSYTNLHWFVGFPSDGANPAAGLVQGSDGNFYGTAFSGGANNIGAVYRITPSGSYVNLYSFAGSPDDGADPQAGLVQGSDGNFYGTTVFGGANNFGSLYRISPSGSYTNLYSFVGSSDGSNPYARLAQGSDGNFYGTTALGGINGSGTVFRLTVLLNPPPWPINQITGAQVAGSNIIFNVVSIEGETYQLQARNSLTSGIWTNVPGVSVTNSIGALLTLTNFGGGVGPQGFYRFDITP